MEPVINQIKSDIEDRYRSNNIDRYELLYLYNRTERVTIVDHKVTDLAINCNRGIAYRCIADNGLGVMHIEKIDHSTVDNLLEKIKENSKFFAKNQRLLLSDSVNRSSVGSKEIKISNVEEKKKIAFEIEDLCYNFDSRVVDIRNFTLSSRHRAYDLCNSNGVDYTEESGLETVLIQLLLKEDDQERNVVGMTWVDHLKNLDVQSFIRETVERGIGLLGAQKVEIGTYNVVFDGQTASKIWKEFVPYFYADQDTLDLSKLNTSIASEILNITDYVTFKGSFNNYVCDSEGIVGSDVTLIEDGILKNHLHNQVTAEKYGTSSTGNGFKDSYTDDHKIRARNFFISHTNHGKNNLLEKLQDGILITEVNNAISNRVDENGNLMLVCSGHVIQHGEKGSPCQHICISINFLEFLKKIIDLGDDHYYRYSLNGTIICPSLLVKDVLVR